MAGSPVKRARREAAEKAVAVVTPSVGSPKTSEKTVQDDIPDGISSRVRARAGTHYARARPSPVRPLPIGVQTRTVTDDAQAGAMKKLSRFLKPGVTLRIERTRPSWAAGYLEDHPIEVDEGIQHLLEHLREEHGGQHYRLTALGPGDQVLYTGSIPVAGPVRDRGKPITRADWEERPTPAPVAAPRQTSALGELAPLMQVMITAMTAQSQTQTQALLAAVKEIAEANADSTAELIQTLAAARPATEPTQNPSGMNAQLTELLGAVRSIEGVKRALGVPEPTAKPETAPGDEQEPLQGAVNATMQRFLTEALTSVMMPKKGRAGPVRPVVRRGIRPTPTMSDLGEIPDGLTLRSGLTPAN